MHELCLINSAVPREAELHVVELFSPPRVTEEMRKMPALKCSPGSTIDFRGDKSAKVWNFLWQGSHGTYFC